MYICSRWMRKRGDEGRERWVKRALLSAPAFVSEELGGKRSAPTDSVGVVELHQHSGGKWRNNSLFAAPRMAFSAFSCEQPLTELSQLVFPIKGGFCRIYLTQ